MLQDLTTAWQASGQADQDFAKWTQDEVSRGCSTNYQSDANYQATTVPDDQATKYKKAFTELWAAIANGYGLPLYQYKPDMTELAGIFVRVDRYGRPPGA